MEINMEPFRIKVIEPIKITTLEQRKKIIQAAHFNIFKINAEDVMIDLLTDSGTSAQSAQQMAALMTGDESYAGSASYHRFVHAIHELMPFKFIFPTHQGRAAERILAKVAARPNARVPNNTFFDTTRANFEAQHIRADDLPIAESCQPATVHPFKGDIDIKRLGEYLEQYHEDVPLVMLTITNNACGGQPVSLANIRATKQLCEKYKIPLFIDSCRFAENAAFIQQREPGYQKKSIIEIVKEIFSYADGMTMSAKKDPFGNIGGWLALNNSDWADKIQVELILSEGFPTYGGLAGRDLDAIAVGLKEAVDEDYLHYRLRQIENFAKKLKAVGVPIVEPPGGHAVFVDARALLPQIPSDQFPGVALSVALYEICGVRSCEIGSAMFGKQCDEKTKRMELLRLAIPRRVYTETQLDVVVQGFEKLLPECKNLRGYKIEWQPPELRHFTAKFARL